MKLPCALPLLAQGRQALLAQICHCSTAYHNSWPTAQMAKTSFRAGIGAARNSSACTAALEKQNPTPTPFLRDQPKFRRLLADPNPDLLPDRALSAHSSAGRDPKAFDRSLEPRTRGGKPRGCPPGSSLRCGTPPASPGAGPARSPLTAGRPSGMPGDPQRVAAP